MAPPTRYRLRQIELPASPFTVARRLAHLPGLVFLDSSLNDPAGQPGQAPLSLVAADPDDMITGNIFVPAHRDRLRSAWEKRRIPSPADIGFPLGGLIGCVGYEGDFVFGSYPAVLVYDHAARTWYETGSLSAAIERGDPPSSHPKGAGPAFSPLLGRDAYTDMVKRAQDAIAAGDIYQANLAYPFRAPCPEGFSPLDFYSRLREVSPAPFAAYLDLAGRRVYSSSPEQFLRISGRTIQTRPIKGTRPRFRDRARDEKSAYDLITSTKEIAELVMITDLERNDIGQICEFGSVEATELLKLERFAQVFHLVSTVEGTLRAGVDAIEALHACFPGGSITGAPKKRAREIIAELEPFPRGLYTGTIGCFGFNEESRFSIVIRTVIEESGQLQFHAGAGIVADSDPQLEWEETRHKACGILRACQESMPD